MVEEVDDTTPVPPRVQLKDLEGSEVILTENTGRWVLLPVEFPTLYEFYKKIETMFWTPQDLTFEKDPLPEKLIIVGRNIAADLTMAFGVPLDCTIERSEDVYLFPDILDVTCELTEWIQSPEGRAFLGFQNMFENLHREAVTFWLKTQLGDDKGEIKAICKRRVNFGELRNKQLWLRKHLEGFIDETKTKKLAGDSDDVTNSGINAIEHASFAEILLAIGCHKLLFPTSLRVFYHLIVDNPESSHRTICNKLTSDATIQAQFIFYLYKTLEHKLDPQYFQKMVAKAISLELEYLTELFPADEVELDQLVSLLRYLANGICQQCGEVKFTYPLLTNISEVSCPFLLPEWFIPKHKGSLKLEDKPLQTNDDYDMMPKAKHAVPQSDENFFSQKRIRCDEDMDF